jgi:hypothetical protein
MLYNACDKHVIIIYDERLNENWYGLRLLPSRSDHDVPNSHVLEDAASVVVTLVDGNQYNSNVIG